MKHCALLSAILGLTVLFGGCSFFKKDIKDSNDLAQSDSPALLREDSRTESGQTEGIAGLSKASKEDFSFNEDTLETKKGTAPSGTAPLSTEPRQSSGLEVPSLDGPMAQGRGEFGIEGPPILPPDPTAQPLEGKLPGLSSQKAPAPAVALQPRTGDPLLSGSPPQDPFTPTPSLSLRTPPPGPATSPQAVSAPGGMNVASAIRPSGLSNEAADPWSAGGTSARPSTSPAQTQPLVSPRPLPAPLPPRGDIPPPGDVQLAPRASEKAAPTDPIQPIADPVLVTTANPPRSDALLSSRKPIPASTTPLPDAATLRAKGVSEYKASQFEQSIETFRKYLGNYPDDNQEIRWRLAQALYESGRWGEASKEFNELRGSPQPEIRADAIYKLGKIDQKKGDLTAAKQQWKRVVDSYPNTVAAKKATESLAENP